MCSNGNKDIFDNKIYIFYIVDLWIMFSSLWKFVSMEYDENTRYIIHDNDEIDLILLNKVLSLLLVI